MIRWVMSEVSIKPKKDVASAYSPNLYRAMSSSFVCPRSLYPFLPTSPPFPLSERDPKTGMYIPPNLIHLCVLLAVTEAG